MRRWGHLVLGEPGEERRRVVGVAGEHEDLPGEPGGGGVAGFGDLDDVAADVVRPGVGRVGWGSVVDAALVVVGEHRVDLAVGRVGLDVLGPVHRGGPDHVGGAAGVDQDVGLGGEPPVGGQAVLALHQGQPGAGTTAVGVAVEAGDVEGAAVEQIQVRPAVAPGEAAGGDELVDVLEPGVVAHVERDAAVVGDVRSGAFVLEPAHRGALARYRGGVGGVDLDDPPESERLVGLAGEVEARVVQLPLALRRSLVEVDRGRAGRARWDR